MDDKAPSLESRAADVRAAAAELRDTVVQKLGDLADKVLGRPELGTDEWLSIHKALNENPVAARAWQVEWHLTKMEIRREADSSSQVGDVVNARRAGASWKAIGHACGITAEDAEQKWGRLVEGLRAREVHNSLEGEDLG